MNLFGLTFTNPALWVGALAVGAPLLIHLLARRTPVRMVFPTVRFLKAAEASHSLPYRFRHYILLLVRTAVVALLLLAFLKPVARPTASVAAPAPGGGRAAVVIVDASASMAYAGPGYTPFARAKAAARTLLEGYGPSDRLNLILAGAVPHPSYPEPSADPYPLTRDLEDAEPTLHRADVDAALAEAVRQLEGLHGYAPEIHLISDFQRGNWAAARFGLVPDRARVVFVSVAEDGARNTAVTDVAVLPAAPAAGESVDVVCKVANFSGAPRSMPVDLEFDGQRQTQDVTVEPGATASVEFRVRAPRPGLFEGTVRIPEDALAVDDVRHFTVRASDRIGIAVLTDEDPMNALASHRFLARAINPYGGGREAAMSVAVLRSQDFDGFAAAKAHLVAVSGVRDLTEASARQLLQYLRDGGGLLYFMANPVDGDNLRLLERLSEGELELPFAVGGFRDYGAGGRQEYATFAGANFDDPVLRKFREYGALGDIPFYRFFATEREAGRGQVLLRYDDKSIALARKSMGAGAILLCNFSPALGCSDLPKRPIFVPLVHEMIRNLRPQSGGQRSYHAGEAASTTVPLATPNTPLSFADPGGHRIDGTFEAGIEEAAVFFPDTARVGFYRVYAADRPVGSVAVNVDSRESNLEGLSPDQLRELSRISRERFVAAAGTDAGSLAGLIEGRPIWHYLLLAALCMLGFEQALTLLWRR